MEEKYLKTLLELLGKAGVDEFDHLLSDPELGYVPERLMLQSEQQRKQAGNWRFFFLRSELELDRLTDEEKKTLMDEANPQQLVQDTLLKVVRVIPETPDDKPVFISMTGEMAVNGSVVLGIATSMDYDEHGMVIDWEAERKKQYALKKLAEMVQQTMQDAMGLPFTVLIY